MREIYNEDCLEVLKRLPDESVDLCVTDCPYHIEKGGTGERNMMAGILDRRCEINRSGKLFQYNEIEFKDWLPEVYRVMKQGTHIYIMINARNLSELQQEAEKVGFKFQQLCVWKKDNKVPCPWYFQQLEYILMLRKGPAKYINEQGTSNLFEVDNFHGDKDHPTQKPVELMEIMIRNSSNKGDVVLDPFMGTGATILAAEYLGRDYIGCEIDKNFYDKAEAKLKEYNNGLW